MLNAPDHSLAHIPRHMERQREAEKTYRLADREEK
jgi:hypothetical protein